MYAIITDITPSRATIAAIIDSEYPTDEELASIGEDRLSYGASWRVIDLPSTETEEGDRIWT